MHMSENILCPQCQRRLRLPAEFQADLVRCPSCDTTFPIASASAAPPTFSTTSPRELAPPPSRSDPRSIERRAPNTCLIVALVLGAVFLIMGVGVATVVVIVLRMQPPGVSSVVTQNNEDEEDLKEQVRQALKGRPPLTEQEIAEQVKPLLQELGAALQAGNPGRIVVKFDQARMVDELAAADGGVPLLRNAQARRDFRRGMGLTFAMSLAKRSEVFQWDQTEIRKVKKLNNDEAVIIARHKHPNGSSLKIRWWVTRRNGQWEIYDFENLDTAWRISAEMAAFVGQGLDRMRELGPALQNIIEASHAVAVNDLDGAEQRLAQVQKVQLPSRFECLRQLVAGMISLQRGRFADSLEALDSVQRLQRDIPLTDFLRGVALNRLGKPDQALKHLRAYRDLLGEDDAICREIAEALNAQGRVADAIKEYRKALGFNSKDEELFAQLASLLFDQKQDDQLQKLLDTRTKKFPDSIEAPRFRYRLLIRSNKTAEAIALFKSTLDKPNAKESRSQLVSEFLWDMIAAGKLLEGYRAAPDAEAAFRQLASNLVEDDHWDDLRRLLEAHREKHAKDLWLAYYQAEVHQHDQAWDKAAKVLSEALKSAPKDTKEIFQSEYVFILYKSGHWQQAYREVEPHDKTFTQLTRLMASEKKGDELEALIRIHKPNAEDKAEVLYYEARAKLLAKKWDEAIALFRKAYREQEDESLRADYQAFFLADLAEQGRWLEGYRAAKDKSAALNILAGRLLYQKKDKELAALLEEHRKNGAGEPGYLFYLGELHLLRGDVRQAIRHFTSALNKAKPEEQWRMRYGLFRARVQAGEALIAYKRQKANEGTFDSLARLCSEKKDKKQLQALLDARRKDNPDDPSLVSYELDFLWLNQDYEGALRLLAKHREDVFSRPLSRWKAEDHRVRCLIKLKRLKEAVGAAEEYVKQYPGDRFLLVLATAATGNVPRTIAAVGKQENDTFFLGRCYQDDDLGPILKSKEFEAFRAKFPEPKENQPASKK